MEGPGNWSPKENFEYHITESRTLENFSVLTCTKEVQTFGIFEILVCGVEGASQAI